MTAQPARGFVPSTPVDSAPLGGARFSALSG